MHKINKSLTKVIIGIIMLSLMTMYGAISPVNAASLKDASDTLSDSTPNSLSTHTVDFTTVTPLVAGQYMLVTLPTEFGDITGASCPGGTTRATTTETVKCTSDSGTATGTYQIIINNVANPSATTTYVINVATKTAGHSIIEQSDIRVAIVDGVSVTATVPATLTFTVKGLDASVNVNGVTTNATSTPAAITYGTLVVGATSTIGQQLEVGTNASGGYTVTVQQNRNLTSGNGADIDSFDNGYAASTTASDWHEPSGNLNQDYTYGHFGFTSDDAVLSAGDVFGTAKYMGFGNFTVSDPVNPIEVMYHNGPANSTTDGVGMAKVAYSIKITALQEAGDYSNTLTYICTPTY
jgi:hypothetical protein